MDTLSGEQLVVLVTLLVTTASGGVGFVAKRVADAKVIRQTAELKVEAERNAALSSAWERLVSSAERREEAANERTDRTIASVAQLTSTVGELSATLKLLASASKDVTESQRSILDELKRCSASIDGLGRDMLRR